MIALRNNAPDSPNLAFPFDAHVGHNVNACDRKPMNVLIYETRLTFRLIDTPNLKAQTSIPTTLTPKSPVSNFHPSTSLYLISSFTASPSTSTIVSIPKVKPVVETRQPLKLLLTGKEIEEDIDLDTEIEIPKIDFNTATIEEMRMISQLLEKKARQK